MNVALGWRLNGRLWDISWDLSLESGLAWLMTKFSLELLVLLYVFYEYTVISSGIVP